jgi:hypothetical protein
LDLLLVRCLFSVDTTKCSCHIQGPHTSSLMRSPAPCLPLLGLPPSHLLPPGPAKAAISTCDPSFVGNLGTRSNSCCRFTEFCTMLSFDSIASALFMYLVVSVKSFLFCASRCSISGISFLAFSVKTTSHTLNSDYTCFSDNPIQLLLSDTA